MGKTKEEAFEIISQFRVHLKTTGSSCLDEVEIKSRKNLFDALFEELKQFDGVDAQFLLHSFLVATSELKENNFSEQGVLDYFQGLFNLERSSRCGKVFDEGDLCFNCRDCQADPTCVFCVSCFQKSDHEGHDVTFHFAGAGGCCDCGDPEAWKPENFCSDHRCDSSETTSLPDTVRDQVEALAEFLIDRITLCLTESFLSFERTLMKEDYTEEMNLKQLEKLLEPFEKDFDSAINSASNLQLSFGMGFKSPLFAESEQR